MAKAHLFEEFPPVSAEQWLAKISADLKGKSLTALSSATPGGLAIEPVYFADGRPLKDQPLKEHPKWDVIQEIQVEDEATANQLALDHLMRGATGLLFYLKGQEDLEKLLRGVEIEYIVLHLHTESAPEKLAKQLQQVMQNRGIEAIEIQGSINFDPLEHLARTGNWIQDEASDWHALTASHQALKEEVKSVCVNANFFANAGASLPQQLGIALAMSYEYVHRLKLKDLRPLWLNLAVGSEYFAEIAKLRAMRRLWRQLQQSLDFPESALRLCAETQMRNKSSLDLHNNLIRSTAEAMAAVIGGANEVSVKAHNALLGGDSFGERLAKNQQNILQHESHLQEVRDMAQGSYFIESLSETLAAEGWAFFQAIEAEGGYWAALQKSWLQEQIAAQAQKEEKAFDAGEKILIGVNKYPPDAIDQALLAKTHFYRAPEGKTTIQPIPAVRLAEKIEQDKLASA